MGTKFVTNLDNTRVPNRRESADQPPGAEEPRPRRTPAKPSTLAHHARPGGRYERIRRGLYRLRQFPSSPHEHLVAAWLDLPSAAVVSHESALELYDLSDVIPNTGHITLPRAKRGQRPRPGVRFHTLGHPPRPNEVRRVADVPVTSPERTIVDSLEAGPQPEQIELAIRQALQRGLTTSRRLRSAAAGRPSRVRGFVDQVLTHTEDEI